MGVFSRDRVRSVATGLILGRTRASAHDLFAADRRRLRDAGFSVECRIERAGEPMLAIGPGQARACAEVNQLRAAPVAVEAWTRAVSAHTKPQRP